MASRAMGHRLGWPSEIRREIELRLGAWMEKHALLLLRLGMGTVFLWFGALKFLGMSPAAALVAHTMSWLPIPGFIHLLGVWEMAIGLCCCAMARQSTAGAYCGPPSSPWRRWEQDGGRVCVWRSTCRYR